MNPQKKPNLEVLTLGHLPWMAHHPPCDRHDNHLIYVAGRPLCLGCLCMGSGISLGAGAIFFAEGLSDFSLVTWVVAHAVLVFPTGLQPWLQQKPYKIFARTLVGFASATWCLGALDLGPTPASIPLWFWGPACILFFYLVAKAMLLLRERVSKSPCHDCPRGVFPTCSWNLEREAGGAMGHLHHALIDIEERGSWASDIELKDESNG